MIKVKDLKEHYNVFTPDRGKTLYLGALNEHGIYNVHKYLATLKKIKDGVYQVKESKFLKPFGFHLRYKLSDIIEDINTLVSAYKYESEFYDERFRDGYFEEITVHHELRKLGFKLEKHMSTTYELKMKNIIGQENIISLSIDGLDNDYGLYGNSNGLKENVKVCFHTGDYGWVEVKDVKRHPDEILPVIHSVLKKIKLAEAADSLLFADKLQDSIIDNIVMCKIDGLDVIRDDFKQTLITRLEETLNKLKNGK